MLLASPTIIQAVSLLSGICAFFLNLTVQQNCRSKAYLLKWRWNSFIDELVVSVKIMWRLEESHLGLRKWPTLHLSVILPLFTLHIALPQAQASLSITTLNHETKNKIQFALRTKLTFHVLKSPSTTIPQLTKHEQTLIPYSLKTERQKFE